MATIVLGALLAVVLIQVAEAQTRHVVTIYPDGADPALCIIDRNDQVEFRNETGVPIVLKLPWGTAVNTYQFVIELEAGGAKAVEWNLDNVNAKWEIDGVVVAIVKTTDDPPVGSCDSTRAGMLWRLHLGGMASD